MRLVAFPVSNGAHIAGWRTGKAGAPLSHQLAFHARTVALCEKGCLDAVFFADSQGFRHIAGRNAFARVDVPRLDPVTLLAALAPHSRNIGLVATLSTSYNEPYSAARRLATLDLLSDGRAGWNVVTSTGENEAHNFGRDSHYGHAERYQRAAEFLGICQALWSSWDEDAIVADRETGYYLDPDRLHGLSHSGAHFRVAGPLNVPRSPQGAPVIFQAGASAEGQLLAARTAEVVFSSNPDREGAKRYYDALKAEVVANGREAGSCLILSAIQPIVAETAAAAREIADRLDSLIHPELALSLLQMQLGNVVDLTLFDPDGPLPDIALSNASQSGQARIIDMARRESLSILELARRIAAGRTAKVMVGTASMVADEMAQWFTDGICDGFIVAPPYLPDSLSDFVDDVIPILQSRGLFRTTYESDTLRGNLGLAIPPERSAEQRVEPEIW